MIKLFDDNGNWAVSFAGMNSLSLEPSDCAMTVIVFKNEWKPTIAEAIDFAMQENEIIK